NKIATNWPERLKRLALGLFGIDAITPSGELNPEIADVPYQLMSALSATLIEGEERGAHMAVLVVHVFTSTATRLELVERNQRVFADFVARIGRLSAATVEDGTLYGPFSVPGGAATRIPAGI